MTDRLVHLVLPFVLCLALVIVLRHFELGIGGVGAQSTTLAIGFLLISAFIGGKVAPLVRMPRITGYLLVGLAVGPYVSELLTTDMLAASHVVEGVAVSLIALTAGGEIQLGWVKKHLRRLTLITACELSLVAAGVLTVTFLGRRWIPFMPGEDFTKAAIIAMVFGAIAVANSPTVTIAVIADTRADGPLARTVLGVTVIKDLCVIVLFAIALSLARSVLGEGEGAGLGLTLAREILGSIAVGAGFGALAGWFLRSVHRDTPVFVLGLCFAISQVAQAFHLEALLIALSAGFWVENFSRARGHDLIRGIERVSLPVYALFFATAGAKVNLDTLATLWPIALLMAGTRAVCVFAGTAVGTRLAKVEPAVRRYGWLGFISQAGVTLALAITVERAFPTWGAEIATLVVAMIAMHELVGPIGFQFALSRAGEIGKAAHGEEGPSEGDL